MKKTHYVHDAFIELLFIGKSICEKYHMKSMRPSAKINSIMTPLPI
jgi:hypothetical protein